MWSFGCNRKENKCGIRRGSNYLRGTGRHTIPASAGWFGNTQIGDEVRLTPLWPTKTPGSNAPRPSSYSAVYALHFYTPHRNIYWRIYQSNTFPRNSGMGMQKIVETNRSYESFKHLNVRQGGLMGKMKEPVCLHAESSCSKIRALRQWKA